MVGGWSCSFHLCAGSGQGFDRVPVGAPVDWVLFGFDWDIFRVWLGPL